LARKRSNKQIISSSIAILLLIVSLIGLEYVSLLRGMSLAAQEYNRGDPESALKRYDDIERRLRSFGAMRFIPGEDRRILFLDEARSLYALGRYDDALERIERESQFSGVADSRFSLMRGQITFRKATQNARAAGDDPQILEDALSAAQDDLRQSLREEPNSWDAKYDFEYVNYIRSQLEKDQKEGMKLLPQIPNNENQTRSLSPKQKP
jgi:tetratricopeptide (TPR) repeat protein